MRLTRLDIQSLPGIQPSFTLGDISAGTNMVTGPNAVGKSSVIRALDYIIGAARDDDPPALSLTAEFETDQGHLTVRRTGREIVWERDGRPTTRPALPDRDQLYCYWLSIEDLLEADQRDKHLVSELRRALRAGYDLEALRREPMFELRRRPGQAEARRLRGAEKALREVENDYASLHREESKISTLNDQISAARAAAARVQPLEHALLLLDARRERRQIEAGLAELPTNMAQVRGDEANRLETIEKRRSQLQLDIEVHIHARDAAQGRLEETRLAEQRPEKTELEARISDLDEARHKNTLREQEHGRLVKATSAERQALEGLGGQPDFMPQLDPNSVAEAETLARELQEKERYQLELTDRLKDMGEAPDQSEIDQHFRAVNALREWLTAQGDFKRGLHIPIIITLSGSLLGIAAALLAQAWLAVVGAGIALIGALWIMIKLRASGDSSARRRFEESGLQPPTAWQREPVEARLQEIDTQRIGLQEQLGRTHDAQNISSTLKRLGEELQTLHEGKAALADKLGFDPMLTAAALDRFVRVVQEYERAFQERQAIEASITGLDAEIDSLTEQVTAFLGQWSAIPSNPSLRALGDGLAILRSRLDQAESAEREKREAEREQQRLEMDLVKLAEDEAVLFREAGLEPDQRTELLRCLAQLTTWREQQVRLATARAREAERHDSLKGEDLLLQRVDAEDRDGLVDDLARTREEAAGLEGLQEERTTILTHLSAAGHDQQLELALAEVDTARSALEDRYEETLSAETAQLLLDQVEERYQSEHEPEVLRDAREHFRRFTHYAFELELDEKEGFVARDSQQQARRTLSELSSATRMQLLIAMRLAWASHLERGGETLPLFFDEALTTSDEHRFGRVAESLEKVVREEGRQIFYLTARRYELALWERATGSRPHHIDLARLRFGQAEVQPEDFSLSDIEPLPSPDGQSPEHYAATLRVPLLDPRQPEGSLHVFYLLRDDLPLLRHLMENWRVTTLGQLETLLSSGAAASAIGNPDMRAKLVCRCTAAHAWIAAWRRGRGKPVDRIALEQSGAVSDRFIDTVTELAESLNGDGTALIQALQDGAVAWFRASNVEELEEWLEVEGYIDPEEPLTEEDRQRSALLDAAGSGAPEEIPQTVQWLEAGLNRTVQ